MKHSVYPMVDEMALQLEILFCGSLCESTAIEQKFIEFLTKNISMFMVYKFKLISN